MEELQAADRQVWYEVNALFQKGWTLDDALHEVCNVRCLLPLLLQPRPALPKHYLEVPTMIFNHQGQHKYHQARIFDLMIFCPMIFPAR